MKEKEVIALQGKLRDMLWSGVVAFLYALGLVLTLLQVTGLSAFGGTAAAIIAGVIVLLSVGGMDRLAAWVLGLLAAAAGGIWLLMGGAATVMEVLQALMLHLSGLKTALPLVAGETAVLLSLLCALASFFVTQRAAGPYPALVVLLLSVVLIWLGNQAQALWCLLPTVVASVTLLLQGGHEISAGRVMPLALAAVLVSYAGVAIGGAAIPPMKEAADALRQRIYDIFLFTGSRDVFSLADIGYYPQGEGQLGGPAEPTEEQVMAVITPWKVYLRGVVKNVYNGRAWLDETESKRYLWDSARFREIRSLAFDMALPQVADISATALLEPDPVIVRMLASSASTMFVPQRVRTLESEGDVVPYFNAGSEIFATRNLKQGDVWHMEAPLFVSGDRGLPELIALSEPAADPNWENVNRTYRALPAHLEQEIYDIAWVAAGDAATPYEKALALQRYLQGSCQYTLDAAVQPPELDFVSTFLLLEKKGYCTHFASAMTVLCRMVGLPARYVEGYVATPDETGMAIVTGKQGHAWTEVYFKGFGWVTFDATPAGSQTIELTPDQLEELLNGEDGPTPTPEAPLPTETPALPESTPTPEPVPTPTPEASTEPATPTPAPDDASDAPPAAVSKPDFPWWLLLAVAVPLALAGRILWMTPGCVALRQRTEFSRWLSWAQATHDALRQMGFVRQRDETPMGFLARVDAANCIPEVLAKLSGAESLMFYGHAVPLPEETRQARHTYEVVHRQLTRTQRILMALRRAFLPRRSRDITA